jgi:glyoxylate/hydroxypyruvate reductase A
MGRQVANRIAAMGYNVWGWRQGAQAVQGVDATHVEGADALTRLDAKVGVVLGPEALPQALAKTHILINVLPLTEHTRGILNADLFAKLPPGASVVNFARGPHVVDADLIDALNQGHLDRAILDVYHQEPLPSDHPFWKHPRIVLWPHIAARTDPMTATQVVVQQLRAWAAAEPVRYVVSRSKGY